MGVSVGGVPSAAIASPTKHTNIRKDITINPGGKRCVMESRVTQVRIKSSPLKKEGGGGLRGPPEAHS